MYRLSQETPEDRAEIEALYDTCFAPGREALSSYRLRDDVPPVADLCLVARDDLDIVAGAVRFWPVRVGAAEALLLGPIAVHPTRQGEGLGGLLMNASLDAAKGSGWQRILLVGDAPYYQRFGFRLLTDVTMPPPTNPARVLGLGDWSGVRGDVTRWTA
ncbi:GNAT family N-acetyltransferase [Gymnodinialimonas ceratoperidinii]|uniref:N-acetyltransferase n=1 Tax=Gymnodinialimonas ceratoperidinii TaxID=2856823 RepID=A0A8F6TY83_9RHOB|nr:N-acetyltransferase [Gymnodinialimonas ceratoperidinii]QXT40890.1 N-acetyltransferase [Gymnodinialimonas ceratoperidinii]